eukprot:NODE_762_length_2114_cov_60.087393_g727_i0.p1 GENE.NODE_762_length_2114_cov_60.087393_g727_i0~~NODE_762_length_2114_cov_60.087393_g727_i0.p1  ORF type:complete len:654 (-),score=85.39 NODE_762_length_2114_cov_60.087393_g727_i0:153-2057(-)
MFFVLPMLVVGVSVLADVLPQGVWDCPCLRPGSTDYLAIQAELVLRPTLPPLYGLDGCRAYDLNLTATGCSANSANSSCSSKWCYVDPAVCTINATMCALAGGVPGSLYSFEACGFLNTYDADKIYDPITGNNALVMTFAEAPYVMQGDVDPRFPERRGYHGKVIDFILDIFKSVNLNVTILDHFGSPESRERFPTSSWTACVHDVAIGNADICLQNFWITPSRLRMVPFLPTLGQDNLYLYVRTNAISESFGTKILKPFTPFSTGLWAAILIFLCLSAFVLYFTDRDNHDDFPSSGLPQRIGKALFFSFGWFTSSGPLNTPSSLSSRIAHIGLGFFLTIILASYTANLATILVAQQTGIVIDSIEMAIAQKMTICMNGVVIPVVLTKYPALKAVEIGDSPWQAHEGIICQAFLQPESLVALMKAGYYHLNECGEGADKSASRYNESHGCDLKLGTRDCAWQRVGGAVVNVQWGVPIRAEYRHSLAARVVEEQMNGNWATIEDKYEASIPRSVCGTETVNDKTISLPLSSMYGVLILSGLLMGIALLLEGIKKINPQKVVYALSPMSRKRTAHVETVFSARHSSKSAVDGHLDDGLDSSDMVLAEIQEQMRALQHALDCALLKQENRTASLESS